MAHTNELGQQTMGLHEESAVLEGGKHDLSGDGIAQRKARLQMLVKVVLYLDEVLGAGRQGGVWKAWREESEEIEREEKAAAGTGSGAAAARGAGAAETAPAQSEGTDAKI